jgi:DNA-binding transcriptional LysR family regulator
MIELDDYASLALFARVVHHSSFSAAAREAGIAKSAVSRRIAKLEETLGVRLLRRSTRSLAVTDDGLRVFEHCATLVSSATAAQEAAEARSGVVRGTLRVNAPVTFAQLYLARAVAAFLPAHTGLEVQLSTDDQLIDVIEGGFDVVVRIGRLADSGLVARRLARDRLVVCAAPSDLATRGEPQRPEDLSSHNCLHYALVERDAEWRFRKAPSSPTRGNFTTGNGTVLREAAVAGLGIAVLPSFMVVREVQQGHLRLILEGARRAEIGIYAVTAHRSHAPARTRAFLDFLTTYFANPEWAALGI